MSTYIKNLLIFLLIFSFATEYTMAFGVKRITETTNHIGMKFIEIPNGSFYMGSYPPPGKDKGIGTAARVPGLAVIGMAIKLMTKKLVHLRSRQINSPLQMNNLLANRRSVMA